MSKTFSAFIEMIIQFLIFNLLMSCITLIGLPQWLSGKESSCNAGAAGEEGLICVMKISWRRSWQSTPVFLPRESHGQRSLVGYSPRGRKELDATKAT